MTERDLPQPKKKIIKEIPEPRATDVPAWLEKVVSAPQGVRQRREGTVPIFIDPEIMKPFRWRKYREEDTD